VKAVAAKARRVPRPPQQEWRSDGKQRSAAHFKQAGVRSWRSFERDAALANVERDGETMIVTPLARDDNRSDTWSDDTQRETQLHAPDASTLASAVIEALDASRQ
jgi:hypothetical protein